MKCFIALGSNLGDRSANMEAAARALIEISDGGRFRASNLFESPALLLEGSPEEWRRPFLNAVMEIEWERSATDLLKTLKTIEIRLGRQPAPRWAPRVLDLDLILFGNEVIHQETLQVPHPGLRERAFVLDPLADLASDLVPPGFHEPVSVLARRTAGHCARIMAIQNLTPDSFSDGGRLADFDMFTGRVQRLEEAGVQILDLGAESTRPGATPVTAAEERRRLGPALKYLSERYKNRAFRPKISVDTRHASTAQWACDMGVDIVNDVSGLSDPAMVEVIASSPCDYVLMHSLSIPADPSVTLDPNEDVVIELKRWIAARLEWLDAQGIAPGRVVFDPGIGFGKTARQSLDILRSAHEFAHLPVRLMVGHSRKSFLAKMDLARGDTRDAATLALSLNLKKKGVDILRVHDAEGHAAAMRAEQELSR